MTVLCKVTKGDLYKNLTLTRWKDGIDIDHPTFAAEWLAQEFAALGIEHAATLEGSAWQGISTVPKDGSLVELWHYIWECPISACWTAAEGGWWLEKTFTTKWPDVAFTHWRKASAQPVANPSGSKPGASGASKGTEAATGCAPVASVPTNSLPDWKQDQAETSTLPRHDRGGAAE
jgi:hypothetical protein